MAATTSPATLTGTTLTIHSEVFGTFTAEVVATQFSFDKIIAVEAIAPDGARRMFWSWEA